MNTSKDNTTTQNSVKPRNSWIAFFLSLFFPGLGQVYNGQPKKGIIFLSLLLLLPLLFGLVRGSIFFYGLLSLFILELGLRIYLFIDAIQYAKRQQDYILKPYNTWYYYLLIGLGIWGVLALHDSNTILGIQTFNIPTPSNNPTLQVGDFLVADMEAYSVNNPDYGDIVIHTRKDGDIYNFRVVALPNDTLELKDNVLKINGKICQKTFIKEIINSDRPALEYQETLPNGHKHLIYNYKEPYGGRMSITPAIVIPPNNYYLLGDNRDNAADSRYHGFVNREKITGQVIFSYWGESFDRINIDFRDK